MRGFFVVCVVFTVVAVACGPAQHPAMLENGSAPVPAGPPPDGICRTLRSVDDADRDFTQIRGPKTQDADGYDTYATPVSLEGASSCQTEPDVSHASYECSFVVGCDTARARFGELRAEVLRCETDRGARDAEPDSVRWSTGGLHPAILRLEEGKTCQIDLVVGTRGPD